MKLPCVADEFAGIIERARDLVHNPGALHNGID